MSLKLLISPAKTLDFDTALPTAAFSQPTFLSSSRKVHKVLKTQKVQDLMSLMDISEKLAELNQQRNKKWKTPFTAENARPAMYAFNGDVYLGLDAYSISEEKLPELQEKLRILSGLYGLLKPLDLIQPYRLEMGTQLPLEEQKNLYGFWKDKLTKSLNKELSKQDVVVNLASKEYSDAIDFKKLKSRVVTPEFRDYKNGKLSMISFYAKKARGLMVRYVLDESVDSVEGLKGFDREGYRFDANLSSGDTLVFTR